MVLVLLLLLLLNTAWKEHFDALMGKDDFGDFDDDDAVRQQKREGEDDML